MTRLRFCTIVDRSCVAQARALLDDIARHHPQTVTHVLTLDEGIDLVSASIVQHSLDELGVTAAHESRTSMLGERRDWWRSYVFTLVSNVLDQHAGGVVFLHPECALLAPIDSVLDVGSQSGVTFVPTRATRLSEPLWNPGVLAAGSGGRECIDWLRNASTQLDAPPAADLIARAAATFEHAAAPDEVGVAWWNVGDHDVGDLVVVHLEGFDPATPHVLARDADGLLPVRLSEIPSLRTLCVERADRLNQLGYRAVTPQDEVVLLPSGLRRDRFMVELYERELRAAIRSQRGGATRQSAPEPFDRTDPDAYVDWLNAPSTAIHAGGRLSNYLQQLWESRPDIRLTLPDPEWSDYDAFCGWVRSHGRREESIDARLLPSRRGDARTQTSKQLADRTAHVVGCFDSPLGLGRAAQLLLDVVTATGVVTHTTTVAPNRMQLASADMRAIGTGLPQNAGNTINIVAVNLDSFESFAKGVGPAFFDGAYTIAQWYWELPVVPDEFLPALGFVDEIWTSSEYVQSALRSATDIPVNVVPVPLEFSPPSGVSARSELDIPERFMFLFAFDFNSGVERKNPHAIVRAFCDVFDASSDGPILVLKTHNGHLVPDELERLRLAVQHRDDIRLVDGYVSAEVRDGLMAECDCYVSLHRSEGLGLTMLEAMAAGKPVIATGYGGNLEFMNDDNSLLVSYDLVEVQDGCGPYPAGAKWAEASHEHAASLMKNVYEDEAVRSRLGTQASASVKMQFSTEACASIVRDRLASIWDGIDSGEIAVQGRSKVTSDRTSVGASPVQQVAAFVAHGPRVRWDTGNWRQRLLLRVLRPYLVRQREFEEAVAASLVQIEARVGEDD